MKIKMIDLLVKIANGEEVPEKIKYKNEIYERYQNISTNNLYYYQVSNKCKFLIDQLSSAIDLLDKVEIIEEPKKVEKITVSEKTLGFPNGEWTARNMDKAFAIKINELIDEINNLKEKKDE